MADTYAEALLIEREGYLARNRPDRVAQVDAELAKLGVAVDDDVPEAPEVDDAPEAAVEVPEVETAVADKPKGRTRKSR